MVFLAASCLPQIPHEDPPAVVEAEFDPSAEPSPAIPAPTDLVYDEVTGHLLIEVGLDDSPISWDLSRFLSALDGWPASMAATCQFIGPVDPATVTAETVRVYDITSISSPLPVDVNVFLEDNEDGTELKLYPGRLPTWETGRRYAVAVLGGEDGVRGAAGEEVVPSSTFWFFRSDLPLCTCQECEAGLHDADGDPWNGCEYACTPTGQESDACDDEQDNDCDGRVDDDDPDCSDRYPEYCNGRDDDGNLEIDEDFDLAADVLNCGACGEVCPAVPGAERACVDGRCTFTCIAGCADADGDPGNGCEDGCDAEPVEESGTCESLTDLIDDVDVGDLEEVRSETAEVFDVLEAEGLAREDVVLAWSFRTSSQVVVPFDPTFDDVHFPNDYFMSDDETHLEVPPPDGSTPESEALLARLNALDGFSATAPGWMRFVGPLDGRSSNLTSTALLVMNADDSDWPARVRREWDAERNEVRIAPGAALHSHTRYANLATRYLKGEDGQDIVGSHVWTILASLHPVVDASGASNIGSVSDEDARDLEDARQEYEELFEELEERLAMPRPYYKVGVVYTTRTIVDLMQELRELPADSGLSTAVSAPLGIQDPADAVPAGYPSSSLLGVVEGTIPALDLIDPASREIDASTPATVDLPFVLALPLAPPAGRSAAPVVVIQHDMDGSKQDLFALADGLAAEGWASIGIDLVGHGEREVAGTSAREALVPVALPFAVGDAMRQQALDLATLVRALKATDGPDSISGVDLDADDVSFLGAGFGAMAGALFIAVDPAVQVAVMSGAGGNLGDLVEHSSAFAGQMDAWLADDLGLEAGSEAERFYRYCWSWAADQGEPGVFARHLVDIPLPGMEPRSLLLQVPEADTIIPAESMEFFSFSAGPSVYPEVFETAGHGFLLDIDDADGDAARAQAVTFIASGGTDIVPAGG